MNAKSKVMIFKVFNISKKQRKIYRNYIEKMISGENMPLLPISENLLNKNISLYPAVFL